MYMSVMGMLAFVCVGLVYWQTHGVVLVTEPLPVQSSLYHNENWNVDKDPWVINSVHRRYLGPELIRVKTRVPIGYWLNHGYISDDHQVILDVNPTDHEKMLGLSCHEDYIQETYPLLSRLYEVTPTAILKVSSVGTMTVYLKNNQQFVLGRDDWLAQWKKAERILKKYPGRFSTRYDLRYHDGFSSRKLTSA